MGKDIQLSSVVQRNQSIIHASVDDEIVMLDIDNGMYYGLDNIASRIWQMLETPNLVSDICLSMRSDFDVAEDQCQCDVLHFLNSLKHKNLISISGSG